MSKLDKSSDPELRVAYKAMYVLTNAVCRDVCRTPLSCCSPEYCEMAIEIAKDHWGVVLEPTGHPTLPLMGVDAEGRATGCVAPPHVRPLCTFHACPINNVGSTGDARVDEEYFELRGRINALEARRHG